MRLTCFRLHDHAVTVAPAPAERDWMDKVPDRHIYRCLPVTIANAHGWQLLCRDRFVCTWDGRTEQAGITFTGYDGPAPSAKSHFSSGIVTFDLHLLFRTEPGWNLFVTGPLNTIKDGMIPLSGVVETDWLPYPFTMNWRFTRPHHPVAFEKGEPIAHIVPIPKAAVDGVDPVYDNIDDHPDLKEQYTGWRERRDEFMARFRKADPSAFSEKWQKLYFRGTLPDGTAAPQDHTSKLRLPAFRELTEAEKKK